MIGDVLTYFEDGYHRSCRLQLLSNVINFKLCRDSTSAGRSLSHWGWGLCRMGMMGNMRRNFGNFLLMQEGIHLGLIFCDLFLDLGSFFRCELVSFSI
jgi:hypothetical protein